MKNIVAIVAVLVLGASWARGQTTQPATRPAVAPADQVLRQLLKPAPTAPQVLQPVNEAPAVDASTGQNAVAPGAPALNVLREGTFIVDRVGRLTRTADGQNEFSFEADGKSMQDPPVLILANLKLMAMENAVSSSNRDLKFRVTGMVTEYRGRNYILLEKVVVVPDAGARP